MLVVDALTELARHKPVRDITVVELVERARIGRSTFYEHFECIESLLLWLVDELIVESADDDGHFQLDVLLTFVGGMPEVSRAFLEITPCAERCESALSAAFAARSRTTGRFAAAGTMGLLRNWLHRPDPPPLDTFVTETCALANATLSSERGTAGRV